MAARAPAPSDSPDRRAHRLLVLGDFWSWEMEQYDRAVAEFDGPDFGHLIEGDGCTTTEHKGQG